jgi:hypothetical protein
MAIPTTASPPERLNTFAQVSKVCWKEMTVNFLERNVSWCWLKPIWQPGNNVLIIVTFHGWSSLTNPS